MPIVRPLSQPLDEEVESIGRVCEDTSPTIRIQILHVPDCPNLSELRRRVQQSVAHLGVSAVVGEIEGPYPSPTLLVNGEDVTGHPVSSDPSCRLDTPTHGQITAAITRIAAKTETIRSATKALGSL